ncbi:hypothetical protein V8F33_010069 [Rhypophila sp. PSN 637]
MTRTATTIILSVIAFLASQTIAREEGLAVPEHREVAARKLTTLFILTCLRFVPWLQIGASSTALLTTAARRRVISVPRRATATRVICRGRTETKHPGSSALRAQIRGAEEGSDAATYRLGVTKVWNQFALAKLWSTLPRDPRVEKKRIELAKGGQLADACHEPHARLKILR